MRPSKKITAAGLLITLGIVYGDIGTSPLYAVKAIMGQRIIDETLIFGALSCIFWTLTIQTTFKYVLLTLKADNKGEGGIFALYALVRRSAKWLIFPAIIGGSMLLADGIITPAISVTSAVEGLNIINDHIPVIPIVIVILTFLFLFQRYGTNIVGKIFGPVMLIWFLMLSLTGLFQISSSWHIFRALHPIYAYRLILQYPGGLWLLGAVFLCTTGAEALYSDLGHCGRKNIRISWIFVKICLLLNYFGQGAWLLNYTGSSLNGKSPFYYMMPESMLWFGIIIATAATIIASQALISGSYTLVREAMLLNFWPKILIKYPTLEKGQIFLPGINKLLFIGCVVIVLFFKESSKMEAAYGLAITLTMLMTTLLLLFYLFKVRRFFQMLFIPVFVVVESVFLVANIAKFSHGGWVTLLLGILLFIVMWAWHEAKKLRNKHTDFVSMQKYLPMFEKLSKDTAVPKYSTNLIYLTSSPFTEKIESKTIYSIFNKNPKRADVYWFINVHVDDSPYTESYRVKSLIANKVIRIDLFLGFRVEPRINLLFRRVVEELASEGMVDILSRYESLRKYKIISDFRFVITDRIMTYDTDLPLKEELIMELYGWLKKISLSAEKAYELDTSLVTIEKVPLIISSKIKTKLTKLNS